MRNNASTITTDEMLTYGYHWTGMLPLDAKTAIKIWNDGNHQLYALYQDDTESAIENLESLIEHAERGRIFGIEK